MVEVRQRTLSPRAAVEQEDEEDEEDDEEEEEAGGGRRRKEEEEDQATDIKSTVTTLTWQVGKNYLRCFLIGEGGGLVLGGRDYCKIVVIYCCANDRTGYILIVFLLRCIAE